MKIMTIVLSLMLSFSVFAATVDMGSKTVTLCKDDDRVFWANQPIEFLTVNGENVEVAVGEAESRI